MHDSGRQINGARRADGGFIFIPVLWVLAFLALVTAILTRTVISDIKVNANLLTRSKAESLADGIARLAIRYVVTEPMDDSHIGPFALDGTPKACLVGDSTAVISIASTDGLVSLNAASVDVLEKVFAAGGAADAKGLAAAAVDFRDADDDISPGGAEAAQYAAAGLGYGPKNAPFSSVDELDQIPGMTADVLLRVRPLLTTHSRLPSPDLAVAGPAVRALSLTNDFASVSRTRNLLIRVSVQKRDSVRAYTREAVVLIERRVRGGFLLKDWIRTDQQVVLAGSADGVELPSCIVSLLNSDG